MRKSMSIAMGHRSRPGDLIGYWKGDRPIYLGAGGSIDAGTETPPGGALPAGTIPVNFPPPPPAPPRALTPEELVQERARWQQEQDQKWAEHEAALKAGFDERLKPFEDERAAREAEAQQAAAAAAEAERLRLESEETAAQRMERYQRETDEKLANYEAQIAQRDEVIRRENERNELIQYRSTKLTEHAQEIHPAMHDMVSGFTQAEIDASIERAKIATTKMLDEFAASQSTAQQQLAGMQRAMPGAAVTQPAAGPIEQLGSTRALSPQELKALSPQEYEALRPQLLQAANAAYYGTQQQ